MNRRDYFGSLLYTMYTGSLKHLKYTIGNHIKIDQKRASIYVTLIYFKKWLKMLSFTLSLNCCEQNGSNGSLFSKCTEHKNSSVH